MDFLISLKPSGMVPGAILVRQAGIALGSRPLTKASNRLVDFLDCGAKHQHRIPLVNQRREIGSIRTHSKGYTEERIFNSEDLLFQTCPDGRAEAEGPLEPILAVTTRRAV
jgi:hypothetical protein